MQEEKTYVLEISRQLDSLKMSVFEPRNSPSTLKQYSQHKVDFNEVEKLSQDIAAVLSKTSIQDSVLVRALQKAGQALWNHMLARQVKERLKTVLESVNLALAIDEELIDIPWELLYDGNDFLSLKFNLGRLVRTKSSAAGVQYRAPAHILKMLILANPTGDLKCAYQEGLNIRNQFDRKQASVHIDFKSTNIDKLYVKKNISDYDIIHFAGHCEYDQLNPGNNGWILSGGKFTIHDILSMGQAGSLPALIFSNACYSAADRFLGQADRKYQEKNYSIAAAFLFSGVRHYIGSIRKIEDSASLSFAGEFYHNLLIGKPVGESVRLARIKSVKDYGITALHWSNYLLYGDPGFVLFKPKIKAARQKGGLRVRFTGKRLVWFLSGAVVLGVCLCLYLILPTLNPNTYGLFLRSQKAFARGDNRQVIQAAGQVISKEPDFIDAYRLLADSYRRLGDKKNALKYYFEYALLAEKKRDVKRLAGGYIKIGWFYQLEGEYPKALDFYNKALDLARKNKDRLNEAIAMRKIAIWRIDKKEYDSALELLTKSSEINRERKYLYEHRYSLACDYFDIGLLFSNKNDFETARAFYQKSRSIFEKLKAKQELSDCYFNLGEVYLFEKQYQKALENYLAGLRIDEVQGNNLNLVSDYNMLGELYMEMERITEAEDSFKKAVEMSGKIQLQPELAASYRNLGLLYKKLGRKNKAKEYLRLAQEIYSKIDLSVYQEVKNEILSIDTPVNSAGISQ